MTPDKTKAWSNLLKHKEDLETDFHLRDYLMQRQDNLDKYRLRCGGLSLDYKYNIFDTRTLDLFDDLAKETKLAEWIEQFFEACPVNNTENRAAMHMALRASKKQKIMIDGHNVVKDVHASLRHMYGFSKDVRTGVLRGKTGKQFTDIVNIGIGGSYLGTEMVCNALAGFQANTMAIHFLSNVDGHATQDMLDRIDPETTLFIVSSKSFTTQETMMNAQIAKQWISENLGQDAVSMHFCAVSTNLEAVTSFDIHPDKIFTFWDWVGGRFSVCSTIGLPICIAIGIENFEEFLSGARAMDHHFQTSPLRQNIPVMMAFLGMWYRNFWAAHAYANLPYDQRLSRFPAYLQQLDMESNGKSVTRDGISISYETGPVVFGEPGTNGQHAFYQLIHQGTEFIPCDFIAVENPDHDLMDSHITLLANMGAQAMALARGQTLEEAGNNTQRVFEGNRPCNIIMLDKMTPYNLGLLIAAYEHKIVTQGAVWSINSFDQWGVELGKILTNDILGKLDHTAEPRERIQALLRMI